MRATGLIASLALICMLATAAPALESPHYEIDVRLDPPTRGVWIEQRLPIAVAPGSLTVAPWIERITGQLDGHPLPLTRNGNRIALSLPAGAGDVLVIQARGTIPALPGPDDRSAVVGAVAGDDGIFLPAGAGWLPAANHFMRYDLTVEIPASQRAVATGRLADEVVDGDIYRARFVADHPAEPPSIFVGAYEISERIDGDIRLRTYFHPELAPLADDYLEIASGMIRWFSQQFGDYPFADFHIVSAPLPVGLGFANLTYVGRRVLPLPFMRGRSLAHEIAHNWWGNGVYIEYAAGNWAEGLTTYVADYALAADRGADAAREMRLGWLRNFTALPPGQDMPVTQFVAKRHDAGQVVGYDKIAFVFHMLRREIGEDAFTAGLRQFWMANRFRLARWSDLRIAFETAVAGDLSWFFDQWLNRTGAPRIELVASDRLHANNGHRVTVTLKQATPIFRSRLPVTIETDRGISRHEVTLDRANQTFELAVDQQPRSVHIDPDFESFRILLPGESPPIFRDVTLAGDTLTVIATDSDDVNETARALAGRLLQRAPRVHDGSLGELPNAPILMIGNAHAINAARIGLGMEPSPGGIGERGTARAWAETGPGGRPWLFVAADDPAALAAVMRPLPHYRNRGFVVFDGADATDKGQWPATDSPLRHVFTD